MRVRFKMTKSSLRLRGRSGNYKRYTRSGGGNTAMVLFLFILVFTLVQLGIQKKWKR